MGDTSDLWIIIEKHKKIFVHTKQLKRQEKKATDCGHLPTPLVSGQTSRVYFSNTGQYMCKIYSWRPPFTPPNPANFFFQSK